ncbi:unnamed protein product [Meganyctiphanes norvegica]|uniref:F-box/LRR-repeat protein 15-like leucin rich repeat domain-containing protein n=1 Tax=Meganyctiphanes norvegica TaxID=48144 RepID=A0AAV2REG2_MEGNR
MAAIIKIIFWDFNDLLPVINWVINTLIIVAIFIKKIQKRGKMCSRPNSLHIMLDHMVLLTHQILKNVGIIYHGLLVGQIKMDRLKRFEKATDFLRPEATTNLLLPNLRISLMNPPALQYIGHCKTAEFFNLNGIFNILLVLLYHFQKCGIMFVQIKKKKQLHIFCSRYSGQSLFPKINYMLKPFLTYCQHCLSYKDSVIKRSWRRETIRGERNRFYPKDGSVTASEHVLTFNYIMKYIEVNATTIKEISLGRTGIDSGSLEQLSMLPGLQLTSLHLMSCEQLSNTGVQLLCQNQKQLEDLDLSLCSKITDHALLAISQNLKNLRILNLRRCNGITERGIVTLSELKILEKLDLSNLENITSKSIEIALLGFIRPTLSWLSLAALQLDWSVVEGLATSAPNLTSLDLSSCIGGVSDKTLQSLCKSLVKLQTLYLNNCTALSDIGLAGHGLAAQDPVLDTAETGLSLEALGLKQKDAFSIKLGSRAERQIRQEAEVRKYLEENIEQIVHSSEHGLSNLPGLRELNLSGCIKITDITLNYALKFLELQFISLSHCKQISESGLVTMARNCPSLEVVMLADCSQVSDTVVLAFSYHLKRLKTLDVQRCILLTNDALDSLGICHNLRYLDVSGCKKMTLEEVKKLEARIPLLHNLHHRFITYADQIEENSATPPAPPPLLKKLKNKFR